MKEFEPALDQHNSVNAASVKNRIRRLFDAHWYLAINSDVAAAGLDPFEHYLSDGAAEGRDPHPLFDTSWYLAQNPDVAASGRNPLEHYLSDGAAEGRDPHPLFDTSWYLAQNPDVAASGCNPLEHYLSDGASEGRAPHPQRRLFDEPWYLASNSDVAAAGLDPLKHYLFEGAAEGRDPHPLFDTSWYLDQNPDVAASGRNPLEHYLSDGAAEGRDPHPLFDTSWYLEQNPDVAASGRNPLEHYLFAGAAEGRDPYPQPLFNTSWYLQQNPDVAAAGYIPLVHYLSSGAAEGRDPHPLFDTSWYLERNPDVAAAGRNPLVHFMADGIAEGRDPHPLFDTSWYLQRNPDVAAAGRNPLEHYLFDGAAEGRAPHPLFDASWYLQRNPDVAAAGYIPLVHYLSSGAAEGRDPHPLFDTSWYLEQNPDVAAAGRNPLEHYLFDGAAEGRDPHLLFDTSWYLKQNPGVAAAGRNPLEHYIFDGAAEGRDPHPFFDASWYLKQNPDLRAAGGNPLEHYLFEGAANGQDPHPLFDASWYLERNPDVAAAGCNPLVHYLSSGAAEGRSPNAFFEPAWYLARCPDAAQATGNPAIHYLLHGGPAGADPGPTFCTAYYRAANRLGEADIGAPLVHYLTIGRERGLRIAPSPVIPAGWDVPKGKAWRESFEGRLNAQVAELADADLTPPFGAGSPTFSITTTVYDTDPDFIRELSDSISRQVFGDFEWLILDNGSTSPATRAACAAVAAADVARVKLFRIEQNRHIIGGNRYLLEEAAGRYIVPVDSDDVLYDNTLAVLADVLRRHVSSPPAIVYSDEQKVDIDGVPLELIWRHPYSLASAYTTAPAAHLLVYSRERALECGVYTNDDARGCHDWDTALRLTEDGADAVHVPEVLYGRRVHAGSTALDNKIKATVDTSHHAVLRSSLERRGLQDRFATTDHATGIATRQKFSRLRSALPSIAIDFVIAWDAYDLGATEHNLRLLYTADMAARVLYPASMEAEVAALRQRLPDAAVTWVPCATRETLLDAVHAVGPDTFAKAFVTADVWLEHADALVQAVGLLELDGRSGIVGGMLRLPGGITHSAGLMAGLDGLAGLLFRNWPTASVPWMYGKASHRVSGFPGMALCVRADLLRAGCRLGGFDRRDTVHGLAFCLEAGRLGYTSVLDEAMEGEVLDPAPSHVGAGEPTRVHLQIRFKAETAHPPISPHLTRCGARFGALPGPDEIAERRQHRDLPLIPALNLRIAPHLARHPTINLLLPGVRKASLSGGPNTALNIGYRLAALGFAVRIFSTDVPTDPDLDPIWDHIVSISGGSARFAHMSIIDASDRTKPVEIGANDIFFATAWWTARMAYAARDLVGHRPFIYLIQDFEPILYPASTAYAAALETYSLPHLPFVNTTLLRDYLVDEEIGLFREPEHRARTLFFDPAIDRTYFYPEPARFRGAPLPAELPERERRKRRLLFYARPTNGIRNLFEIGVAALRAAISEQTLSAENWEFVGMGEAFAPFDLGCGARLACAPWLGFDGYAQLMRDSDIILSLMLSPHPSYPPLEMAGCGGIAVTNTYGSRTATKMAALSSNIIAVEPNVPAIVEALIEAVGRLDDCAAREAGATLALPATWDDSFATAIPALSEMIRAQGVPNDAPARPPIGEPSRLGKPGPDPDSAYAAFLADAAARRALVNHGVPEPGLFTFVTTVWNTAPAYLDVLARSLHRQVGGQVFEWFILDNGTTRPETRAFLETLAERRPYVRLERVESNLGIIGGMRYCLERARGRYILPLDSDDYINPDCLRTLAWYVQKYDYPPLLYTDEDKLVGERLSDPFQKPDWDPVLFSAQCYIAHLCAIDRARALELDVYGDPAPEGSHDWDTFTRFWIAGHTPIHVPHVLYAWRLHPQSTAGGNMESKPVVFDSQRAVLKRFLAGTPNGDRFELVPSPLFGNTPDWWMRRRRIEGRPITTILLRGETEGDSVPDIRIAKGLDHEIATMEIGAGPLSLKALVIDAAQRGRLVHLMGSAICPDDDEWAWEAIGLFDRHPDTVAVGGRIHADGHVLETGRFLGFGDGCGCPDRGRPMTDPGYAAQVWKPRSVSAVCAMHAVFDAAFLAEVLTIAAEHGGTLPHLGAWAGGHAKRAGHRVIYSPFLSARTRIDYDALVGMTERSAFLSAFIDLMPEDSLLPAGTGLNPETAYRPVLPVPGYRVPAEVPLPDHAAWLTDHAARRSKALPAATHRPGTVPAFSLLTTLYIKTDAALFAATAESVLAQSCGDFEWLVLAHGPITTDLDAVLDRFAPDARIRLLRLPTNLGIVGGMRHVLEAARGRYVISLDGDDLLMEDALAIFSRAIRENDAPALLYTDEDIIIGSRPMHPYLRPDWDPVLDLENSWIWHACAMRRETALELGVYTDPAAEYCHDWDSIDRFAAAGYRPVHVPEIVYHWRHHDRSTSNSEGPNEVSAASVRHVLQRKIDRLGLETRCRVAPYPIWRGAQEWWISRELDRLPSLVALTDGTGSAPPLFEAAPLVSRKSLGSWREALDPIDDATIVAVIGSGVVETGGDVATREIAKMFEVFEDAAVVTGPVVHNGVIRSAGLAMDGRGALVDFLSGRPSRDPGSYALTLKPLSIAVPVDDWFFARANFLKACLATLPDQTPNEEIALWIGACALAQHRRIIYTPLVTAETAQPRLSAFERRSTNRVWRRFLDRSEAPVPGVQATAAYRPPRSA
ncbi:glycosyltransferase [Methylobacterium fujisawaense]|uniref:rhamnosyltransferase WsaF family glycosyltransferase n=1 Tax=Methylobacterium fujisawaense TaxID=107400 RepID=UPI003CE7E4F1